MTHKSSNNALINKPIFSSFQHYKSKYANSLTKKSGEIGDPGVDFTHYRSLQATSANLNNILEDDSGYHNQEQEEEELLVASSAPRVNEKYL